MGRRLPRRVGGQVWRDGSGQGVNQRGLLLDPDNLSMRYNLACALIMELHDLDAALDVLEPFFEEVKSPIHVKHLTADPDLNSIRDLPRFKTMLAAAKQRIGMPA